MEIRLRRGIDLRFAPPPRQIVEAELNVASVAILGRDYPGLRPTFLVDEGHTVIAGQPLIEDRRVPGRMIVAPASGRVARLVRGARRSLSNLLIEEAGDESVSLGTAADPDRGTLVDLLLRSGGWAALRTRPFGSPADLSAEPQALFITAIDSRPLAANPPVVIDANADWFARGAQALTRLTTGPTYLCHAAGVRLPASAGVTAVGFSGPHPAGLAGTHIHHLHPVDRGGLVWQVGYQDVIALGHLLATGNIWRERVVALGGPAVTDPCLIRTRPGARLEDLASGRLAAGDVVLYSGSLLDGAEEEHLSQWHVQVSATHRSAASPRRRWPGLSELFAGRHRTIIPNTAHERAAPPGTLPIPLLRAISIGDAGEARRLGVLGLIEEDLALLSHVDGTGTDFGALLRATLDRLTAEGT